MTYDPDLRKAVYIYFKPEGVKCEQCQTNGCRHIRYALSKPEVQKIIQKKRKEGWKIPE